jgi:mRNA-degrading endonuclease RelE of RelBE toxin-antitoxin system
MVKFIFEKKFKDIFSKLNDDILKKRIVNQLKKIENNPEAGKPMMFDRKGTRELYITPFRLSYSYDIKEGIVYILDLYHKKKQ